MMATGILVSMHDDDLTQVDDDMIQIENSLINDDVTQMDHALTHVDDDLTQVGEDPSELVMQSEHPGSSTEDVKIEEIKKTKKTKLS